MSLVFLITFSACKMKMYNMVQNICTRAVFGAMLIEIEIFKFILTKSKFLICVYVWGAIDTLIKNMDF